MGKSINKWEFAVLCDELRNVRLKAKLSQVELAQKLGVSQTFVSASELGFRRQDLLQLMAWCAACGTTALVYMKAVYDAIDRSRVASRRRPPPPPERKPRNRRVAPSRKRKRAD